MSFENSFDAASVYAVYRFGRNNLAFRGPEQRVEGPFIACIGGSETFGKFVDTPYPALLARQTGRAVLNFGASGAGPCAFSNDDLLLSRLNQAALCVVQVTGAASVSNRFYTVRRRRNEKLQSTARALAKLYPDVDLARFRFTHRLLGHLFQKNREAFGEIEAALKTAWLSEMRRLLGAIDAPKLLFWFSERTPATDEAGRAPDFRSAPAFVDAAMIEALSDQLDDVVTCCVPPEAGNLLRLDQPVLLPEQIMRRSVPSARMHARGADCLAQAIEAILDPRRASAAADPAAVATDDSC
ncbi:MAG: DUF6473 family protein [Pseudomonadota bacterium]